MTRLRSRLYLLQFVQALGWRARAWAEGTVRNHVSTILAKLEVADRAQATAVAWRSGLVGQDALDG